MVGERLVGLARVLDDSELVAFVHYVLVHPEYQGQKIAGNMVEYIRDKYKDINIDINDNVIDEIVNKCEFYEFGARRIDKIISKDIENFIIDGVIRGDKNIYIDSIVKKNITS